MNMLPDPVFKKIRRATPLLKTRYTIDKTLYTNVYITSDIHCDLEKLHMLLENGGLINKPDANPALSINIDRILNTEWIAENTLFIIVGDLVDGTRKNEVDTVLSEIPDRKGNIELLLHAYLYNLRIKARLRNSEVRFTLGNHDYHSIIKIKSNNYPDFYSRWVHNSAKVYFSHRAYRRACLMPFYECCFFLVVAIGTEIGCIHGGFSVYNVQSKSFNDITQRVIEIQERIETAGYRGITDEDHAFLSNIQDEQGFGKEGSPLWSRRYASDAYSCAQVKSKYKMVVVGHCQMAGVSSSCATRGDHTQGILRSEAYTRYGCGGQTGCVVLGCGDAIGPRLAFVDIGFSRTFSPSDTPEEQEKQRRAEVLHLKHDPTLKTTARYYNVIMRKNLGGAGVYPGAPDTDVTVWSAVALPSANQVQGGRRSKKQRNRRKAVTRRSNLHRM
jgi:hypothetical protein